VGSSVEGTKSTLESRASDIWVKPDEIYKLVEDLVLALVLMGWSEVCSTATIENEKRGGTELAVAG
jgi:hypothetical protein